VAPAELYVGLARDRVVAIVDTVTDRVVRRISLESLGRQGHLSQIGVGPSGNAAILPVTGGTPDVGLVCPAETTAGEKAPKSAATIQARIFSRRPAPPAPPAGQAVCTRVPVVSHEPAESEIPVTGGRIGARDLVADATGSAYVVVADAIGAGRSDVAVIDLATGVVQRRLPLAEPGDRVGGLAVAPDGSRLFAAVYTNAWPAPGRERGPSETRIVAVDTKDGRVRAMTTLPAGTGAVSGLVVGARPGSVTIALAKPAGTAAASADASGQDEESQNSAAAEALYIVIGSKPARWAEEDYVTPPGRPMLLALDTELLETLDLWSLERDPAAVAVLPDGRKAYVLEATEANGPWARELVSLDLAGGTTRRWPMASGAFALELSPVGKLYVADTLNDRIWRLDTRTDTLLSSLYLSGAPLALGARPA
jgi:DNA-binding beta-propeller fold protein YncE